jgi:hypothetical protein
LYKLYLKHMVAGNHSVMLLLELQLSQHCHQ